jgi:hypothetical protein
MILILSPALSSQSGDAESLDFTSNRAVKQVELDERYTIVLSQDQQGKPQLWFELTVSEAEVQHVPNPLHSVDKPAARTRAAPKQRNPEDSGASWPFIN